MPKFRVVIDGYGKKIPAPIWGAICCKFKNENGVYFNERLAKEVDKRRAFTASRRKNLHMESLL